MGKNNATLAEPRPSKLSSLVHRLLIDMRVFYVRHVLRRPIWYTDRNNIRMELLPRENLHHYFEHHLLLDDPGSVALLKKIIKPGMTVFDIGAHAGAFSLLVAQLLQGRGVVHAFEPTGNTYRRLLRNIEHNQTLAPSIKTNRVAVTGANGHVTLNTFPPHLSVWNTIGRSVMEDSRGVKVRPSSSELVSAVMVDTYCREQGVQEIDLLKIDVEGFEDEVIAGCRDMISRHAVASVLFEISLAPLESAGKSPHVILRTFAAQGFKLYIIADDGATRQIADIDTFKVPFFANYYGVYTR